MALLIKQGGGQEQGGQGREESVYTVIFTTTAEGKWVEVVNIKNAEKGDLEVAADLLSAAQKLLQR